MGTVDRRTFLKMVGVPALAAALPLDLGKALAIPANNRTGSINDVEHVIFMMQENRSFDHYFGTLRGVRGFADPHPVTLPSGKSVWHQANGSGELLPYRPDVPDLGQTFLPDPPHGWNDTHAAWNAGRYDQWVPNKGITTMTYHTRKDLPYQFALADAFTVCDNYHCSLLGPTDPNRYHMWTGWVGNDGNGGGPVLTNAEAGYDWSTYPERLERNGISWKVYQDVGDGLDAAGFWGWTSDPYIGNYGDNSLLYFHQYQHPLPGTPLAVGAKSGTDIKTQNRDPRALLADFREDVRHGRLPKVSWIVAPEAYTEHPNWEPDFGSWYVSQVVDILASNPDVWSKMALFITYDEEGGFFDHLVPPTPPQTRAQGLSTVPTTNEIFAGNADHPAGPYGLGVRVPMIVVSPWTRGGWVNSQAFDHTSLIRFLETRFGNGRADLVESNITPWRRAVVGDLTTAFDFKTPNASRHVTLPDTSEFEPTNLVRHPDDVPVPPADQELPGQERGVRRARAIPYTLHVDGRLSSSAFSIDFKSSGAAAAVFHVRSAGSTDDPRSYTVEAGKKLTDTWDAAGAYDLSVYGPNGFFRGFKGSVGSGSASLDVKASYDERHSEITLSVGNRGSDRVKVTVHDAYASKDTKLSLRPGEGGSEQWSLSRTRGWYDLVITVQGDSPF
ncbi:MAG: phospholipase, partial [Actinomycetota bacterium]|nr:phospholipase [Actinomycetota bacterium]